MKAWLISGDYDDYGAEVVFAESRNKAKMIALYGVCADTSYINETFGTGYWYDNVFRRGSRKVIAWAPLPAPYVEPTDEPSAAELRGEAYWVGQGE